MNWWLNWAMEILFNMTVKNNEHRNSIEHE